MIKKFVLAAVLCVLVTGVVGSFNAVHAHFDTEDPSTGLKSSFHATPDHSPIAGKESVISYDFSKYGFEAADFTYQLTIKKVREKEAVVSTQTSSYVVIARYIFPTQGLYILTLTATPKDGSSKPSVLTFNQRVSRGEVAESKGFGGFELGILGIVLGIVGIVFVVTFRDKIKSQK